MEPGRIVKGVGAGKYNPNGTCRELITFILYKGG